MRLTVPVKAFGQRFALPILVLASIAMIVLGKADALLFDGLRASFDNLAVPALSLLSQPTAVVGAAVDKVEGMVALYADNARLRQDNDRLLHWQQVAQGLIAENDRLRDLLKLAPDPGISYVTVHVVANSGGSFVRSILVDAGAGSRIGRGQAAITGEGLVGRVTEVGEGAARILLLTDINSRIPVTLDQSRERAVLAGDNSDEPRLLYLPRRSAVQVGDRLVSSGDGGIFPPGLPVGIVASTAGGLVRVEPYADLARLDYLRIVDYGLNGVLPQPIAPRPRRPARGLPRDGTS